MGKHTWLMFVIGTILTWGAYIPTIHSGQLGFGDPKGPLRAFMFVGVTYFLMALIVPGVLVFYAKWEPAVFPVRGMAMSTAAGIFGALGALGVILALVTGGMDNAKLVPPLVFAGAPIMSVVVNMFLHPPKAPPVWQFYVGILLAACGAALVLRFKPV